MPNNQPFNKKAILEKIIPIIESTAKNANLELVEADLVQEGGFWHLRIFIYNYDHNITHEDCEKITRNLDEGFEELIPVQFYLEVSSPGVERKLKSIREYTIFKGKKVEVKLKHVQENLDKIFTANIINYCEETGLELEIIDKKTIVKIPQSNVSQVRLKADFDFGDKIK